jgi:hypothetical protein
MACVQVVIRQSNVPELYANLARIFHLSKFQAWHSLDKRLIEILTSKASQTSSVGCSVNSNRGE